MNFFVWHTRYPVYQVRMERMARSARAWMTVVCELTLVPKE